MLGSANKMVNEINVINILELQLMLTWNEMTKLILFATKCNSLCSYEKNQTIFSTKVALHYYCITLILLHFDYAIYKICNPDLYIRFFFWNWYEQCQTSLNHTNKKNKKSLFFCISAIPNKNAVSANIKLSRYFHVTSNFGSIHDCGKRLYYICLMW